MKYNKYAFSIAQYQRALLSTVYSTFDKDYLYNPNGIRRPSKNKFPPLLGIVKTPEILTVISVGLIFLNKQFRE